MTDILTPTLIVAIAVAAVLGGAIGVGLMLLIQRSQSNGKTLAELRQEQDDYRQEVEQHFEQTAALLKDMSENYRTLYEHMATGAQALCMGEPAIVPPTLGQPETPAGEAPQIGQTRGAADAPSPAQPPEEAMPGKKQQKEADTPRKQSGKSAPQDVLKEDRRDR